jgi:uncharacterized protein (TIGR01440 family)
MNEIERAVYEAARELLTLDRSDMRPIRLMVVGCSTSEIAGGMIGKASVPELGPQVAGALMKAAAESDADLAFQCCEHLNRALVMEREAAEKRGCTEVCAIPHPKAGGSCASAAYRLMKDPVLVESVSARDEHSVGGKTPRGHMVNFPGSAELIGKFVEVEITSAGKNTLRGRII